MAFSYHNYVGDNSTTTFNIPFTYTATSEISVTVDGVAETGLTFPSSTEVTLTSAPATNTLVQVRRTTVLTSRTVDFASGSVLTEEDLDNSNIQVFHASQEAVDKANDSIALDNDDKFDAQSKVIKNLADPVDNNDAVNKQFISTNLPNITTVAGIAADVTTVAGIDSDVTAVAADATDIGTVSTNIANVNKVGAIDSDVTTVAGIDANVTAVAGNATNINTVAGISADVTTVAGISTDVTAVEDIASNVTEVAGISANVSTVAGISANVTTVAGNDSNITAVAGNATNINSVAGISSDVTSVAGISSDVTTVAADGTDIGTVAGISANVTTVAGISGNVTTVAGVSANVTTVAGISSDVTTVAGDSADIQAVAADSTDIGTVATNIANVNAVGGDISNVNTVATNIADVNSFANTYFVSATAPSSPTEGDLWFDTTNDIMKVYDGAGFVNAGSSVNGTANRVTYTATAGQTSFNATYDAGYVDVYLNGVKLITGTDFTATNGSTVVLATGAALNDTVDIVAYGTFNINIPNIVGDVTPQLGGNLDLNSNDITGTGDINITGGLTTTSNVGIGTNSANARLEVFSADATTMRLHRNNASGGGGIDFYNNTQQVANINAGSGNLNFKADPTNNAAASFISFETDGSEVARIDSSGNVLVGKTVTTEYESGCIFSSGASVNAVISADNDTLIVWADNGTANTGGTKGHVLFKRGTNGVLVGAITSTTTSTSFNTSSDYRLKENAVDMTGAITRVKSLQPKRFNFISDTTDTLVDGFMAHEAATVVPEAITGTKDAMRDEEYEVTPAVLDDDGNEVTPAVMGTRSVPDYQGIDQSKLVPLLTGALQEAIAKIETLETEMTALQTRVTNLENV